MKLNMVAYLAKAEVTQDDIIENDSNPSHYPVRIGNLNASLYIKTSLTRPNWANLFLDANLSSEIFDQKAVKGLFLIEVNERFVAFTFGHGRSMLNKHCIERGFGLRVAMNLGDPAQLKSIDKSTLDKVALNTRSQSSKNTGVEDFSFEFDHEIMKSMTAIVDRDDDELEIVSGKDSVAIYTDVSYEMLGGLAKRLLEAYESDLYKERYPWAEYVSPETDPKLKSVLDSLLVSLLNAGNFNEFWMCAPDLIDYTNFSGFRYNRKSESPKYTELNLSSFISDAGFRGDITVTTVKNKKVYILNSSDEVIDNWSFFQCIGGEIEYEQKRYILNDGLWYSVSDDFYAEVCNYFHEIPHSDIIFPGYGGLNEGPYLNSIANGLDLALLDQKWVRPRGVSNNLEFCDLYSSCKAIIHVKKYGSSAVLNHLFAQAYQSIEMLVNSPEVIDKVNEYLTNTSLQINYEASGPRQHRIVLAIMYHRNGDLDIPFFAKVNLRHHCRKIRGMGFKVELAKIPIGGVVFNNSEELRALLEHVE